MKEKLLLHTCCAPCLTSVYEKLEANFDVNIFWFNPNIEPEAEGQKRLDNLKAYLKIISFNLNKLYIDENDYNKANELWHKRIRDLENEPEGGKRCLECFKFRLEATANFARNNNFKLFTTTLSVSPWKNSKKIISIEQEIAKSLDLEFLNQDFKKNDGYKRSIELSKEFNIYRQNYCGCLYSKRDQ